MMLQATAVFTPRNAGEFIRERFVPRIMAAVAAGARVVADEARAAAPVATGELAASIMQSDPVDLGHNVTAEVSAGTDHCMFVEFGTGLRGSGTYPYQLPQHGVPITGSWIYDYKHQNWKGMVAQPYLRPALDTARSDVLKEFEDRL